MTQAERRRLDRAERELDDRDAQRRLARQAEDAESENETSSQTIEEMQTVDVLVEEWEMGENDDTPEVARVFTEKEDLEKHETLPDQKDEPSKVLQGWAISNGMAGLLKHHQNEAVNVLLDRASVNSGSILAHPTGTGKTLTALTFVSVYMTKHPNARALVVCPRSLALQWQAEMEKFHANLRLKPVTVMDGSAMDRENRNWVATRPVLIITEEVFKRWHGLLQIDEHTLLLIDEAHTHLKNCDTKYYDVVSKQPTKRLLLITGTPVQNNLKEYYHMVTLAEPGLLGSTVAEFEREYVHDIRAAEKPDADEATVTKGKRVMMVLRYVISGVVQLLWTDVLSDLPPKKEFTIIHTCSNSPEHRPSHINELVELDAEDSDESDEVRESHALALVPAPDALAPDALAPDALAPDVPAPDVPAPDVPAPDASAPDASAPDASAPDASAPDASAPDAPDAPAPDAPDAPAPDAPARGNNAIVWRNQVHGAALSAKTKLVVELIDAIRARGDERILVFSQRRATLRMFQQARRGDILSGEVKSIEARQYIVDKFHRTPAAVLYVGMRVGGVGLNLNCASRVILADMSWNPMDDKQAVARAYRLGQTLPVVVYRLCAYETLEERAYWLGVDKTKLATDMTDQWEGVRMYAQADFKCNVERKEYKRSQLLELRRTDPVLDDVAARHGARAIVEVHDHVDNISTTTGELSAKDQDIMKNDSYRRFILRQYRVKGGVSACPRTGETKVCVVYRNPKLQQGEVAFPPVLVTSRFESRVSFARTEQVFVLAPPPLLAGVDDEATSYDLRLFDVLEQLVTNSWMIGLRVQRQVATEPIVFQLKSLDPGKYRLTFVHCAQLVPTCATPRNSAEFIIES
jgi:superfamily II DNA or RNA helicase